MSEKIKYLDDIGLRQYDSKLKEYIRSSISTKVDKVSGKGLSTNDYTTEEKTKLADIENGANKTIIDSSLSSTSTNPVQNKVVNETFLNYYTKTQIDSLELITIDDIDTICGQKIYMASEVEF